MVHVVLLAVLALHTAAPEHIQEARADTSRAGSREFQQETRRAGPAREPSEENLFLHRSTILDRMLSEERDPEQRAASIDSLLKAHPELRQLVLRTLLMPKGLSGFYASNRPSVGEAWRLVGNSRMTPFEQSGLIKARQMELHDRWTEGRMPAPPVDMIGTLVWLLELLR
jgi:hypothetical protein